MENTDIVYLKYSFICSKGNTYHPKNYIYGELPKQIRDNREFVVPVEEKVIEEEIILNPDNKEEITLIELPEDKKDIEVKTQYSVKKQRTNKGVVDSSRV